MKESLFNKLLGLGGEDITTEILVYLLKNREYKHIANLIMPMIIEGYNSRDNYIIESQKCYGNGRPDIVIENTERQIVIENKFDAEFSKEDQFIRYIDILTYNNYPKKQLILLTVSNKVHYLRSRIMNQIEDNNIEAYCLKKGIIFKILYWNNIIDKINTNDTLTKELKIFIDTNYIRNTNIGDDEMELMNSNKVPELFEKIWNSIDVNKNYNEMKGYKVSRTSQSRTTYLYNIEFSWGKVCIQYFHEFWKEYKTPFSIQVMNDWNNRELNLKKLEEVGFKYNDNYEYIFPIVVDGTDINEELNLKIIEILKIIEEYYGK